MKKKIFCIGCYLLILAIWNVVCNHRIPKPVSSETYIVQNGDTLWTIAKLSDGYNEIDRRYITDDIAKLSDCNANLRAGQVVKIPMYKGN